MISALPRQVPWLSFGAELNLWQRWHPVRPFVYWFNSRIMNHYAISELDARWAAVRGGEFSVTKGRSVVDLALKNYVKTKDSVEDQTQDLDPTLKTIILGQIKLFLFSGHNTASSSTCYLFHVLSQSQDTLAKLRKEHADKLTSDAGAASVLLSEFPHLRY